MKKLFLAIFLSSISNIAFSKIASWFGSYHYYGSEEILENNIATIEIKLSLNLRGCNYSINGYQVDENFECKTKESNGFLYVYKVEDKKLLAIIFKKKMKYYIISDNVLDPSSNVLYKDE